MTGIPPLALHPARVRERITELERAVALCAQVINRLEELVDEVRREASWAQHQLDDMRAHPAVAAALEQDTEQAVGQRDRHPGPPWTWLESIAGGGVLVRGESGLTLEVARDNVTGRIYGAPAGTPPPDGDDWTLARIVLP